MNRYQSNPGLPGRKSDTKSRANRFRFFWIVSAVLFLSLVLSLVFYGGDRKAKTFVSPQTETNQSTLMPKLDGEKAREYLEKRGLSDSLGEAVTKARYKVRPVETKSSKVEDLQFEAGNPRNGYRASFKTDGAMHLNGGGKNYSWKTSFKLEKIGRGLNLKTVAEGEWEAEKSRAENKRDAITEWYENKPSGLEHGFNLSEKPETENASEQLLIMMKIDGDLPARLDEQGQTLTLGTDTLRYSKLKVQDAAGAELPAKMELRGKDLTIIVEDSAAIYPVVIDPVFEPVKKLTAADGAAGDQLGFSVSISGDTAIVGAYGDDSGKGAAYIFERNTGGADNWGEVKKLMASDGAADDAFGISVSISGDTAIVGAAGDDGGKGSAYIFNSRLQSPVQMAPIADKIAFVGQGITVQANATSTSGAVTYSFVDTDGLPAFINPSTGFMNFPKPLQEGKIYTIRVRAANDAGFIDHVFRIKWIFSWQGFQPPINQNGSSVFSRGATTVVQVKFKLGFNASEAKARLFVAPSNNLAAETLAKSSDGKTQFIYNSATKEYQFNWSPFGLAAGSYRLRVDLGDGETHTVFVALR